MVLTCKILPWFQASHLRKWNQSTYSSRKEVWEPRSTPPQYFQHPNYCQISSIIPYLHLCYQRPWPSFHLLLAGSLQEPHNCDLRPLCSYRDCAISTASSCLPVTSFIKLWPHDLWPCLFLLQFPSPHIFTLGSFFLTCHVAAEISLPLPRISLTKILNVNLPSLDTVTSQFGILYLFPIISSIRIKTA